MKYHPTNNHIKQRALNCAHGTFTKIDHTRDHKTNLNNLRGKSHKVYHQHTAELR